MRRGVAVQGQGGACSINYGSDTAKFGGGSFTCLGGAGNCGR